MNAVSAVSKKKYLVVLENGENTPTNTLKQKPSGIQTDDGNFRYEYILYIEWYSYDGKVLDVLYPEFDDDDGWILSTSESDLENLYGNTHSYKEKSSKLIQKSREQKMCKQFSTEVEDGN